MNNTIESGAGGSFTVNPDGSRTQVEPARQAHADGDCARDAEGNPLEVVAAKKPEPALPPPAPAPWLSAPPASEAVDEQ